MCLFPPKKATIRKLFFENSVSTTFAIIWARKVTVVDIIVIVTILIFTIQQNKKTIFLKIIKHLFSYFF